MLDVIDSLTPQVVCNLDSNTKFILNIPSPSSVPTFRDRTDQVVNLSVMRYKAMEHNNSEAKAAVLLIVKFITPA